MAGAGVTFEEHTPVVSRRFEADLVDAPGFDLRYSLYWPGDPLQHLWRVVVKELRWVLNKEGKRVQQIVDGFYDVRACDLIPGRVPREAEVTPEIPETFVQGALL